MTSDLISIIVPCYNQGEFLNEALQSVFQQTYSNWECIIVNDGSKDDTEEVAKLWTRKDNRFSYYKKENSGVSHTRNFALEKVKGKFLQFLDADDILDKQKLELSLKAFAAIENKDVNVVVSNFRMLSYNSEKTTEPYCNLNAGLFTFETLLYKWQDPFSVPIHCGLFEASLFKTIRFPENVTAQEDWIVWVTLFKSDCKAAFIDKPLAFYRLNPLSRTISKSYLTDQIKTFEYFKTILSKEEYHRLSVVLISRYYRVQEDYKNRLRTVKNSKPYQTGLLIKKVLSKLRLLKLSRKVFPTLLKFKSK
ncbi:glycosyltransferase family 2 protein [Algibacter sp. 2305UL17-15]|uniref:glycosyltransferase family 2 protein n=1 Tax=Algibacter sp. 2305UL17-15 TaxID=3231268 RepID=UPI00345B3CA3